ncbi:trypsin alpha-like [Haematobia irritans]|uniref:trypsin alpha-like n=1 Tax=Haematobia irritans TaxID=7368 RepID=UPI003F50B85F
MYRNSICVLLALIAITRAQGSIIMPRLIPDLEERVVGGEDTTIGEHPYQVSVRYLDFHICGGSIYRERVVITAAHCIRIFVAILYSIQYGITTVGGYTNVISAIHIVPHPQYDASTNNNDIALIFLLFPIPFGPNAQPIELATADPAPDTPATVTGWGASKEGGAWAKILQKADLQIVARKKCGDNYKDVNPITITMICAAAEKKDACQGDSGGPLAANGILVGVVSWGNGCARPNYPGVYSNVAYHNSWIQSSTT